MKNKIVFILALSFATLTYSLSSCNSSEQETKAHSNAGVYQCPMDCEDGKTYSESGQCPVCEMDLEDIDE